jgi:hypothetical protein
MAKVKGSVRSDIEVQRDAENPYPKGSHQAKLWIEKVKGKIRFISTNLNQMVMEPHKEKRLRDPQTGDVTRVYIREDGEEVPEIDLRTIDFRPTMMAFTDGYRKYGWKQMGQFTWDPAHDDKFILELCRRSEADAAKAGPNGRDEFQEYPWDAEIQAVQDAEDTGSIDARIERELDELAQEAVPAGGGE